MLNKIPIALVLSRLIFALLIILLSLYQPAHYIITINVLLVTGLITDIFDGIIARKLNISTVLLRRLDSAVDQVFWISALIAVYILCPDFFTNYKLQLIVLLSTEAATYILSYLKFKKEVATHAIASKIWTLSILATLIQLVTNCTATWIFQFCFYLGMITRLEIIGIILILRKWENDVPTVYHAILLRKGKPISRNKMFNG